MNPFPPNFILDHRIISFMMKCPDHEKKHRNLMMVGYIGPMERTRMKHNFIKTRIQIQTKTKNEKKHLINEQISCKCMFLSRIM